MNKKFYIASFSGGKDSTAMILKLVKEGWPLDYVLFYDTGMEFKAIYTVVKKMTTILERRGIKVVTLKPENDYLYDMLLRPIKSRKTGENHYGYEWCGGMCRWRTSDKVNAIQKFLDSLGGEYVQYIGIAADEPLRIKHENGKVYPLVEWGMTETDCLQYCYDHNVKWVEPGILGDLYQIGLKRVSCWCCCNKSLDELRAYYQYMPYYWELLKGLQSRIDRPFRSDGKTIFDLEERFKREGLLQSDFSFRKKSA